MGLTKHVEHATMLDAGFNEYEPSFSHTKGRYTGYVYHTKIEDADLNIVIIEIHRLGSKKRQRNDYYFGTFHGKHSGEHRTTEEARPFFEEIDKIATRRHRINARDLEAAIQRATEETRQKT